LHQRDKRRNRVGESGGWIGEVYKREDGEEREDRRMKMRVVIMSDKKIEGIHFLLSKSVIRVVRTRS
jgi:hypothetical protein